MRYEDIDAVNWSTLKHILRSPAHYQEYVKRPMLQTPAQRFGVAVHEAILEPDKFKENYVKAPNVDRRTKEYKDWAKEAEGIILSFDEWEKIASMHENFARMTEEFNPFVWQGAEVEQSLVDTLCGVKCKGRADILTSKYVWDIKTCQDASESAFRRDFFKFNYAAQLAFYADLSDKEQAGIIAIEKDAPYSVNVFTVSADTLEIGRQTYKQALAIYSDCCAVNDWPGYTGAEL